MLQSDRRALGEVYRHRQRASFMLWFLVIAGVLDAALMMVLLRSAPPVVLVIPAVVLLILWTCAYLFHSLSVEVTPTHVRLWFGPGLIRRSFAAADIRAATPVRNHWIWGWGIRWTPHGWLFNVSGLDAVEIELRNGRQYRIGTDQPRELAEAIRGVSGTAG